MKHSTKLGCLLLVPLLLLILFIPTQVEYCDNTRLDFQGKCIANLQWRGNGVVLEVIVRWFVTNDWSAATQELIKNTTITVAVVMGISGILLWLGVFNDEKKKREGEPEDSEQITRKSTAPLEQEDEQDKAQP